MKATFLLLICGLFSFALAYPTCEQVMSYMEPATTTGVFFVAGEETPTQNGVVIGNRKTATCGTFSRVWYDFNGQFLIKIISSQAKSENGMGVFNGQLDKPIIVPQGFDPGYFSDRFNFGDFEELLGRGGFLNEMYTQGYDICMVLFQYPLSPIAQNSQILRDAISKILSHSLPPNQSMPILVGPSMGGVISRHALQEAGRLGDGSMPFSMFIGFDSPSRGAIIPISVQSLPCAKGSGEELCKVLRSGAASDMLIYQTRLFSNDVDVIHHDAVGYGMNSNQNYHEFYQNLNSPLSRGYAKKNGITINGIFQPTHMASISNGSRLNQTWGYSSTSHWLRVNQSAIDIVLQSAGGNQTNGYQVMRYDPAQEWEELYYFSENCFSENSPGGYRGSYKQAADEIEGTEIPGPNVNVDYYNSRYENHSFIPTFSARGDLGDISNCSQTWSKSYASAHQKNYISANAIPSGKHVIEPRRGGEVIRLFDSMAERVLKKKCRSGLIGRLRNTFNGDCRETKRLVEQARVQLINAIDVNGWYAVSIGEDQGRVRSIDLSSCETYTPALDRGSALLPNDVFDEIFSPTENQLHVDLTSENISWFIGLIRKFGLEGLAQKKACNIGPTVFHFQASQ